MRPGAAVVFGRWACVTAGEYDRRAHRVTVNEAVVETVQREAGHPAACVRAAIVAHEQAHADAPRGLARLDEERLARDASIATAGVAVVEAIERVLRMSRDAHRTGR